MADENININIDVNTSNAGRTIGDLKKEFKELKTQLSDPNLTGEQFKKLTKQLNDVEGALGDMNDAAKAASGSGVEQLKSSVGLLQEGFTNFDTGKMQIGFKALGTAMKAIPIFLIIEGVKYLVEAFDGLTKSNGFLGDAFRFIGEIIDAVKQSFKDLSDAIGLTTFAADEAADAQIKAAERTAEGVKNAGKTMESVYDRQIALAKAQGKNTSELEKKKQEDIIKSTGLQQDELLKQSKAIQEKYKNDATKRDEELKKVQDNYKQSIDAQVNAVNEIAIIEANSQKEASDKYKTYLEKKEKKDKEDYEKRKKLKEKEADEEKKRIAAYNKLYSDALKEQEENDKDQLDEALLQQEVAARDKKALLEKEFIDKTITQKQYNDRSMQIELENTNLTQQEIALIKVKYAEKDKQLEIDKRNAEFDIAKQLQNGLQSLSDISFAIKSAKTKKDSAESEQLARKQFNVNKAFQISSTTIQGIQNGITAYGAGLKAASATGIGAAAAPAVGAAYAAISGLGSLASIAKIASTQFGGAGGVANIQSGGGTGAGAGQPTQQFQAPTFFGLGQVTGPSQNNGASTQRVYVTETDISKVQNRVSVIESRARIGG